MIRFSMNVNALLFHPEIQGLKKKILMFFHFTFTPSVKDELGYVCIASWLTDMYYMTYNQYTLSYEQ